MSNINNKNTPLKPGESCIVHETKREKEKREKEEEEEEEKEEAREQQQEERDKGFECSICLEIATEPVVTQCGHLFW